MKSSILLLALTAAAFSSCTTAYKTGQTPDDVYYSPTRPQDEYVKVEKQDDKYYDGNEEDYYEDRFLRMRLSNRYRWSALDDYYFHNTYAYNAYGSYNNWYSPWNSYWAWNSFYNPYNPYCGGFPGYYYTGGSVIKNPRVYTPPSRAMVFNPNSYLNTNENRRIGVRGVNNGYNNTNNSRYNNQNSNRSPLGQSVRKVFSNSNNDNSNSTPSRTYNPSSNNNSSPSSTAPRSSSSSSSSGGGSRSRPPR